jgi:hypothetical protein
MAFQQLAALAAQEVRAAAVEQVQGKEQRDQPGAQVALAQYWFITRRKNGNFCSSFRQLCHQHHCC